MKYTFTIICLVLIAASVGAVVLVGLPRDEAPSGDVFPPLVATSSGDAEAPAPAAMSLDELPDADAGTAGRPAKPKREWATPVKTPGLPNLHRVSESLYRGAQPTAEGIRELKAMGVRTIINLRSFHSDRDKIGETGLAYERIYMKPWHAEEKEIVRFLQIVTDGKRTPAFVHCQHGADRTGTMIAVYRVAVQGWHKEEALREMTEGPYNFHGVWRNLIAFLKALDVEAIRKRAGLPPLAPPPSTPRGASAVRESPVLACHSEACRRIFQPIRRPSCRKILRCRSG